MAVVNSSNFVVKNTSKYNESQQFYFYFKGKIFLVHFLLNDQWILNYRISNTNFYIFFLF